MGHEFPQNPCCKLPQQHAAHIEHLEDSVESALLLIGYVALGGRNSDIIRGHTQNSFCKAHQHHCHDREIKHGSFHDRNDDIIGDLKQQLCEDILPKAINLNYDYKNYPEENHGTVAIPGFYDGLKHIFGK